ncbi:MAG TPA: hypothetical protein VGB07_16475 [Blastocatellia bacterium]
MLLWVALGIGVIAGLLQPFTTRLHGTGIWAGKALVSSEARSAFPRGLQDAITDGWPSIFSAVATSIPYVAMVIGFFYAWWAGIASFFITALVSSIAGQTSIASKTVDRYLALFMEHAYRRSRDYASKGDAERAEIAKELSEELGELLNLYLNTGVPAPTTREARAAPHGEPDYLLKTYLMRSSSS